MPSPMRVTEVRRRKKQMIERLIDSFSAFKDNNSILWFMCTLASLSCSFSIITTFTFFGTSNKYQHVVVNGNASVNIL